MDPDDGHSVRLSVPLMVSSITWSSSSNTRKLFWIQTKLFGQIKNQRYNISIGFARRIPCVCVCVMGNWALTRLTAYWSTLEYLVKRAKICRACNNDEMNGIHARQRRRRIRQLKRFTKETTTNMWCNTSESKISGVLVVRLFFSLFEPEKHCDAAIEHTNR